MTLSVTKTTQENVTVNTKDLKVSLTNHKDVDSVNFEVYYQDSEIGYGHLNNKTNFAHVTLNDDNQDLEDYLVDAIENRNISIN